MKTKAGFIVYGTHKDGLLDPMGTPFIDQAIVDRSKEALKARDIELVEWPIVVKEKFEAKEAFTAMKKDDSIDALILFAGTWIWSGLLIAAAFGYAPMWAAVFADVGVCLICVANASRLIEPKK